MKRILGVAAFGLVLGGCGGSDLPAVEIEAVLETASVAGTGDAADDPAIWVADTPSESLVFGTDKDNGVYIYTMTGGEHAYLPEGRLNNVDVRYDFALNGRMVDIAGASDRSNNGVAFFFIDPDTRAVTYAGAVPLDSVVEPYGFCFYRSRQDGELYAFVSDKEPGTFVQLLVGWDGAAVTVEEVRRVTLGTIAEGCVTDERTGRIYMNEENVGVWMMGAEPSDPAEPVQIAAVDGQHLTADAEGAALLPRGETGGWLVVSSQSDNAYVAYDLETHDFVARFRIVDGAVDGVTHTDGLEISTAALGDRFPEGILVVQDDENETGGQNFKFVDLRSLTVVLENAAGED